MDGRDGWWSDLDEAALGALVAAGGRLTIAELAGTLAMSEDAARAIVMMLAERGHVRVPVVELARPRAVARPSPDQRAPRATAVTGEARRVS